MPRGDSLECDSYQLWSQTMKWCNEFARLAIPSEYKIGVYFCCHILPSMHTSSETGVQMQVSHSDLCVLNYRVEPFPSPGLIEDPYSFSDTSAIVDRAELRHTCFLSRPARVIISPAKLIPSDTSLSSICSDDESICSREVSQMLPLCGQG